MSLIRFCCYNVENLFLSTSPFPHYKKSESKTTWLAKVITDIDADIYLLSEVGGVESLEEFNKDYLDDKYHVTLIRGNSERGIELGYLIRKSLDFKFEHLTHRNRPLNFIYTHHQKLNIELRKQGKRAKYESELMSRDIAELRVFDKSANTSLDKPLCIFLGVHLKSKLDDTGVDFNGVKRRASEVKLLIDSYKALRKKFHYQVPIFLSGDFNGDAGLRDTEPEFQYIYEQTNLKDIADLLNWNDTERTSFVMFDKNKKPVSLQLDYFFMEEDQIDTLEKKQCCIYRYQNENVLPIPQTPHERAFLPSDHYPLVIEFKQPK